MSITPGIKHTRKLMRIALKRPEDAKGSNYILNGATTKPIMCKGLSVNPWQPEQISRDLDDSLSGGQPVIHTGEKITITGSVEMAGSGTPNVPVEYAALFEIAGYKQTINASNVTYTRIKNTSDEIDGTIYFDWDGIRHHMRSAKATLTRRGKVGEICYLDFECVGVYGGTFPSTMPFNTDFSGYSMPVPFNKANTTFTIDDLALNAIEYEMSMGNQLEYDEGTEVEQIFIANWSAEGKVIVEAPEHGTFDPFGIAQSNVTVPTNFIHGGDDGNIFDDKSTGVQILGVEPGEYKGKLTWEISFREIRGNDGVLKTQ